MSFSAANMCRFVIVVIFISFVSCVLAEAKTPASKKNGTETCVGNPKVKISSDNLTTCFDKTVARHLNPTTVSKSGGCQNASDFGKKLNDHFNTMKEVCSFPTQNTTDFIKFVDFSLQNDSFNKFYADISCVKNLEFNISTCVKEKVGFFNITKTRKHTRWYRKANLHYNRDTCSTTERVKNCVVELLKSCQNESREYVASLFNYARELGDCANREKNTPTIPPPGGIVSLPAAPVLSKAVIIILSIGGVVVVAAIITIIVLKCKHLKA